jgi:hypothetical protein
MLDDLQNEVNKLLFHYYNSIGLIQRDFQNADIDAITNTLLEEIKASKKRIDEYLAEDLKEIEMIHDYERIIEEGENYVKDATYLIDALFQP